MAAFSDFLPHERITALAAWDPPRPPPPPPPETPPPEPAAAEPHRAGWAGRAGPAAAADVMQAWIFEAAERGVAPLLGAVPAAAEVGPEGMEEEEEEEEEDEELGGVGGASPHSLRSHPITLSPPAGPPLELGAAGGSPQHAQHAEAAAEVRGQGVAREWRRLGAYLAVGTSVPPRGSGMVHGTPDGWWWRDESGVSLAGRILVFQVLAGADTPAAATWSPDPGASGSIPGSEPQLPQPHPALQRQARGQQPAGGQQPWHQEQQQQQRLRLDCVCELRLSGRVLALCAGHDTPAGEAAAGAAAASSSSPSSGSRLFASVGRRLVSFSLSRHGQLRRVHWTPTTRVVTSLRVRPWGQLLCCVEGGGCWQLSRC